MFKGIIYKATNKINQKVYIGQTYSTNKYKGKNSDVLLNSRKQKHYHRAKENNLKNINNHFSNALNIYKEDDFEWDVLICCFNIEELNIKEIFFIKLYNSFNEGYNSNTGGSNYIVTKEVKEAMSKLAKERMAKRLKDPLQKAKMTNHYYNVLSKPEVRRRNALSIKRTANTKEQKELKSKLSKAQWAYLDNNSKQKRINNSIRSLKAIERSKQKSRERHYKKFNVLENGVVVNTFLLITDCANHYNVSQTTVSSHLKKKYKSLFLEKYTLEYV